MAYNSGGVKVDQFATEVGLGWTLEAGPTVDKEVIGMQDYRSIWKNTQTYGLKEYTSGYLTPDPSWGIDSPDLYNTSINGRNHTFYIDKSFTPVLISPYNGLNISIKYGRFDEQFVKKYGFYRDLSGVSGACPSRLIEPTYILGYYSDFQCEDVFRTYNDTKSIEIKSDKYTYSFKDNNYSITASSLTLPDTWLTDGSGYLPNFTSDIGRLINKYNISEVIDNLSQKKINFYYEELAGFNGYVRHQKQFNTGYASTTGENGAVYTVVDGHKIDYDGYIKKMISKIVTDKEEIEFVYSKTREDSKSLDILLNSPKSFIDYYKDPLLSKIYIKDKNKNIISTYTFNYGYFDSQCTNQNLQRNPEQCKRLKLLSIVKSKNDTSIDNEKYSFEYYEDGVLPQIGSYRQDPFGYKNELTDSQTSEFDALYQIILPKKPKLYYYQENMTDNNTENTVTSTDKFTYLSSINIPVLNPNSTDGYEQNMSNLQNSRIWSLKSIEYPTKGKQLLNYELNSFSWKGNVVNGGGIRVSKIDLIDGATSYSTKYVYENGKVISLPSYNTWTTTVYDTGNTYSWQEQNFYPKLYYIKGGVVTYGKVNKIVDNIGKTVKEYSTIADYPLKLDAIHIASNTQVSLYPYYFSLGNLKFEYLFKKDFIGNIKKEYVYDKNDNLLKKINYQYSNEELDYSTNYPLIKNLSPYPVFDPVLENAYYPTNYSTRFITPIFNYLQPNYKRTRNNLTSKTTIDYLPNGNVTSIENYSYLNDYNSIKNITKVSPTESILQEFLYPYETGIQYNSLMANDINYKYIQVGSKISKNSNFVSGNINIYSSFNNTQLLPSESKSILKNNGQITEITYDKYDTKGNILQYTPKTGIPVAIIWGYNQTQPIAKIEGIGYDALMALSGVSTLVNDAITKSNADIDATTEQTLITALTNLRNNSNVSAYTITTYTYDPLVGVTTVTQPSGMKEIYKYDTANRLQSVIDMNGKVLKEYQYNYKQ